MVKELMGAGIFPVRVTAVDEAQATFDGRDPENTELFDIRMMAVSGVDGTKIVPAAGSTVLVQSLGQLDDEFVAIAYGRIDKVVVITGTSQLQVLPAKITLGDLVELGGGVLQPAVKGSALNANLAQLNSSLVGLTNALTVFSIAQAAAAAASPSPGLAPAYTALLTSLQSLTPVLANWPASLSNHLSQKVTIA